eukprot:TRINITY_DN2498_c0_g1_i1.p1 TRINITY_DN2498_c0_g1~~TRINITY_DN2498_c0_g1_i1.p1  ORF type:complete len:150 (-),score=30.33 TRINITY_DN2498_c0_g1_i1:652-1101(-)
MLLRRTFAGSLQQSLITRSCFRGFATATKDYYDILGVSSEATPEQIKEAYVELAKKYHPEVNTTGKYNQVGAKEFQEIAEAYSVLSSAETRFAYDVQKKRVPENIYRAERQEKIRRATVRTDDGQTIKPRVTPGIPNEGFFIPFLRIVC